MRETDEPFPNHFGCRLGDSERGGALGYCPECRGIIFDHYRYPAGPDRLETETALDMRGETMEWKDDLDVAGGAVVCFASACGYIRDPVTRRELLREPETVEILFKEFREMALWMADLYTETQGLEDAA
jgi:hypothetical protein